MVLVCLVGLLVVVGSAQAVLVQQQTITQTSGAADDFFGRSVALSSDGNTAIVGAPQDDVARRSPWTTFNGSRCAGYFCAAPSGRSAPSTWR